MLCVYNLCLYNILFLGMFGTPRLFVCFVYIIFYLYNIVSECVWNSKAVCYLVGMSNFYLNIFWF